MANQKLFPIIVGKARIRDYDNNGSFVDLECATNVRTTISTSETIELVCGGGDSLKLEKPSGSITLKVIKTKNPDLIAKLLNLDVKSVVSGKNTITDQKHTSDKNGVIELLERSNDKQWVTELVVKSLDGQTTYELNTDYSVSVVDNKTIIQFLSGALSAGDSVLISGKITQNAYKQVEINKNVRAKKKFTIELYWEDTDTKLMTYLLATPVELDSEYMLEMADAFRDGEPNWSELNFNLVDGGKIIFKDENI